MESRDNTEQTAPLPPSMIKSLVAKLCHGTITARELRKFHDIGHDHPESLALVISTLGAAELRSCLDWIRSTLRTGLIGVVQLTECADSAFEGESMLMATDMVDVVCKLLNRIKVLCESRQWEFSEGTATQEKISTCEQELRVLVAKSAQLSEENRLLQARSDELQSEVLRLGALQSESEVRAETINEAERSLANLNAAELSRLKNLAEWMASKDGLSAYLLRFESFTSDPKPAAPDLSATAELLQRMIIDGEFAARLESLKEQVQMVAHEWKSIRREWESLAEKDAEFRTSMMNVPDDNTTTP